MVSCKIIQSVLEVLAEVSMPCYNRLQSKYSTASADAFILIQDILSHLNGHLRRQGEAGIASSELGILIKSTIGDAIQRKRHRLNLNSLAQEKKPECMHTLALKFLTVPNLNHHQKCSIQKWVTRLMNIQSLISYNTESKS